MVNKEETIIPSCSFAGIRDITNADNSYMSETVVIDAGVVFK